MKKTFFRRDFLKAVAATTALAASPMSLSGRAFDRLKISFSTLGCPGWDIAQIVSFAKKHGYHGVEFRGLNGQLDLLKSPHFVGKSVAVSRRMMEDNDLEIVCLGSSAQMHHRETVALNKNLDEAKGYIDLAAELGCPFVRVFPEKLGQEEKNESLMWIADNLKKLGEYAGRNKVVILLESHGDLVRFSDLEKVMKHAANAHVGLIWDIANMWSATGERPLDAFSSLAPFIRHVHVKDGVKKEGKLGYVLPGKGEVPVAEALMALQKDGYEGFYSFEWEKLWHPELDEPEIALAYYPAVISKLTK